MDAKMPSCSQMPSSCNNQHDWNRTLSDDELQEIFASRRRYSSTKIQIGTRGWIEKLDEALLNDEAIALSGAKKRLYYDDPIGLLCRASTKTCKDPKEYFQKHYAARSRVKHLELTGSCAPEFITAATHLNLESFSLGTSDTSFLGQCLVKLVEGEKLTSLALGCDGEFEGLVEALESPKCHLSRLELRVDGRQTRLVHAISSLTSLQCLKLRDWEDRATLQLVIGELAAPHCNIWDFELDWLEVDWLEADWLDDDNVCLSLADVLQNPDCKLLKLALGLTRPGLVPFHHLCKALQSPNCKLQHLHLRVSRVTSSFLQELGNACQTAHKLTSLSLCFNISDENYDFFTIFFQSNITRLSLIIDRKVTNVLLQALKHPRCRLRNLRIRGFSADGQIRKLVIEQAEIVNFLDRSFGCPLEILDIDWESDALRKHCLEILKRNKIYRHADQQPVEPSRAKLFICGAPEVGKTTITKNLFRTIGVLPSLQRHLSTYGIRLHTLGFGSQKLRICDLAGQKEFHAFHHYFVRGSDKDLFLVVCKAPGVDGHEDFENQLRYWLRFIVSHSTVGEHKPRVMVALNYFPSSEKPSRISMTQDAINRCSTLVQEYSEHISFGSSNDSIFGLVATKVDQVRSVKQQLETNLGQLLRSRPKIPKVCDDIMKKSNKFSKLVKVISVEEFRVKMRYVAEELLKVALVHLHDIAEVIHFEQETEDPSQQLLILDVQWFVRDVVGQFLPRLTRGTAAAPKALPPSSMAIAEVKSRLASQCGCQEAHFPYILRSLHRLGVLLPVPDIRHPASVKVLAFLTDPIESCPWKNNESDYTFWGRRFSCKDAARTLLPSGIFAMLQVELDGKFAGSRIGDGWLHLVEDGIAVMVKVGGVRGDWYDRQWIDVLVRIPFSVDENLLEKADALFHGVKKCVFEICGAHNWGCPFIELEEQVIRPEDVGNLQLTCAEVAPLAQILEEANSKVGLSYSHTWTPSLQGNPVFEIMLPSERSTYFHEKLQNLNAIDHEVHDNLAQLTIPAFFQHEEDEHSYQLKNAVEEIVREMKQTASESENRIINEIKRVERTVLKQMKILQDRGDQILAKLKLHLDFQWPRYPHISNADNVLQRLSGKGFGRTWQLHLLCEHGPCHQIAGQKGKKIRDWPGWLTDVAPVLVPALRLLFFIGKVAAIASVGVAIPLVSPEPLFKSLARDAFPDAIEKVFGAMDESMKTNDLHKKSPTKDDLQRFYDKFLNGKDLEDTLEQDFGLYHVTSTTCEHVWVCKEHMHSTLYTQASRPQGRHLVELSRTR